MISRLIVRRLASSRRRRARRLAPESLELRALLAGDVQIDVPDSSLSPEDEFVSHELPEDDAARTGEAEVGEAELAAEATLASPYHIAARQQFQSGIPVLVRVQRMTSEGDVDRSVWEETLPLSASDPGVTLSSSNVTLYNGVGSALVTIDMPAENDSFELMVGTGDTAVSHSLTRLPNQVDHVVSGTLTGVSSTWSGVVHVTDDVVVPAGHTLTIEPGTLVLIDGAPQTPQVQLGVDIQVAGSLVAVGTADNPITLTASEPQRPWGRLNIDGGSVALEHVVLTRAGSSPRGGHTNTGPAVRMTNDASLNMTDSSITDISGKILQSNSGALVMHDTLLSRAVMGPEIDGTSLDFQDSWIIEMAGRYHHNGTVDDNDGIYLHSQRAGQTIQLLRSVVASVQDDGIDTLGSDVLLDDVIVRDVTDKGISVFNGSTTVRRSLLVNADIGIETKGSGSEHVTTNVDQTTIANVQHAIRAHDKDSPDPNVVITYNIRNSILHVVAGGDPLFTDYDPADLHVNYTWSSEAWQHAGSGEGNVVSEPYFVDVAANDYRLTAGSAAIDAGDPAYPVEDDGTRVDLGFRPYVAPLEGDLNGDRQLDAADIDLLCAAIADAADPLDPSHDLNGDQRLDSADMDWMLAEILHTTRGDANLDGVFDSSDLVLVFQAGHYEDSLPRNSGWATGDWNCDGEFTTSDLVAAFQAGGYQ